MPNIYTPTPVILPATIPEMADGDPRTAASVTQITRPMADAIAYLFANAPAAQIFDFTTSGGLVVPANAAPVVLWMGWGAGGAGGPGSVGADVAPGGSGGEGAPFNIGFGPITPGGTEPVTIPAGPAGGAVALTPGDAGGDTLLGTAGAIAFLRGGSGGNAGTGTSPAVGGTHRLTFGGRRPLNTYNSSFFDITAALLNLLALQESQGGFGVSKAFGASAILLGRGGANRFYSGGVEGSPGDDAGLDIAGGGPGGGGGAGPGGPGGDGGNGGNSGSGGAATADPGAPGGDAGANTGAGGGGGGAGGTSLDDGPEALGPGGDGGSGFLRCILFVPIT